MIGYSFILTALHALLTGAVCIQYSECISITTVGGSDGWLLWCGLWGGLRWYRLSLVGYCSTALTIEQASSLWPTNSRRLTELSYFVFLLSTRCCVCSLSTVSSPSLLQYFLPGSFILVHVTKASESKLGYRQSSVVSSLCTVLYFSLSMLNNRKIPSGNLAG